MKMTEFVEFYKMAEKYGFIVPYLFITIDNYWS